MQQHLLFLCLFIPTFAFSQPNEAPFDQDAPRLAPTEHALSNSSLFIKFSSSRSLQSFLARAHGAKRIHPSLPWVETTQSEWQRFSGSFSQDILGVSQEQNYRPPEDEVRPDDTPLELWGLEKIRAPGAWPKTTGNVVVAIVDSGLDLNHAALQSKLWTNERELRGSPGRDDDGNGYVDDIHGYNFLANRGNPSDDAGHGSHVAGTVGGVSEKDGFSGVAPGAQLMALKTHDGNTNGTEGAVVRGILYAADMGARVINCSWGGDPEAGKWSQLLYDAIDYAGKKGAVVVAAAGNKRNDNDMNPHYPSSYDLANLIAVAASSPTDKAAVFSNYGKKSVDIGAPGRDIVSIQTGGGYVVMSGTSMAAPHVSGALALLAATPQGNSMSPERLIATLLQNSVKLPNWEPLVLSGGRLDLGFLQ